MSRRRPGKLMSQCDKQRKGNQELERGGQPDPIADAGMVPAQAERKHRGQDHKKGRLPEMDGERMGHLASPLPSCLC